MIKHLYSIREIIKMFDTGGSHPLLVTCNDLNEWVCKYERTTLNLFNEYLAYHFALAWGLRVPEIARVSIHPDHIPAGLRHFLPAHLFQKDCFGSRFIEHAELITLTFVSLFQDYHYRRKIVNKSDFLKIALFDLWLANEDRNHNNFNMLLEFEDTKAYFICPIDHVMILNSSHLDYEIALLTEDESIINTPLANALFSTDRKLGEYVDEIVENFYLCTQVCEDQLPDTLSHIPVSWDIDVAQVGQRLRDNIFLDYWKRSCEQQFRELIQRYIV